MIPPRVAPPPPTLRQLLEAYERVVIIEAVVRNGGSRTRAARSLGVRREYLHERMRKLKIDVTKVPGTVGRPAGERKG